MSSNTQVRVSPTIYEVLDRQTVPIEQILGAGGTNLLQGTLRALSQVRQELGEGAAALLDWKPVQDELDCYETIIDGASVSLRLGGTLAEVAYSHQIRSSGQRPSGLEPAHQRAVNRKVNQLLAVAMGRRISQKLARYAGTRVQQRIEQHVDVRIRQRAVQRVQEKAQRRVANRYTLRLNAQYTRG